MDTDFYPEDGILTPCDRSMKYSECRRFLRRMNGDTCRQEVRYAIQHENIYLKEFDEHEENLMSFFFRRLDDTKTMVKKVPKAAKKDTIATAASDRDTKEIRIVNNAAKWWAFMYWLWKFPELWKVSSKFRFGIVFLCAENMWAAMQTLSSGERYCDTAITKWIEIYSGYKDIVLRQLRLIKVPYILNFNAKEVATHGMLTYAGHYGHEVMHEIIERYPAPNEYCEILVNEAVRENELAYGVRHLSHSMLTVSLIKDAVKLLDNFENMLQPDRLLLTKVKSRLQDLSHLRTIRDSEKHVRDLGFRAPPKGTSKELISTDDESDDDSVSQEDGTVNTENGKDANVRNRLVPFSVSTNEEETQNTHEHNGRNGNIEEEKEGQKDVIVSPTRSRSRSRSRSQSVAGSRSRSRSRSRSSSESRHSLRSSEKNGSHTNDVFQNNDDNLSQETHHSNISDGSYVPATQIDSRQESNEKKVTENTVENSNKRKNSTVKTAPVVLECINLDSDEETVPTPLPKRKPFVIALNRIKIEPEDEPEVKKRKLSKSPPKYVLPPSTNIAPQSSVITALEDSDDEQSQLTNKRDPVLGMTSSFYTNRNDDYIQPSQLRPGQEPIEPVELYEGESEQDLREFELYQNALIVNTVSKETCESQLSINDIVENPLILQDQVSEVIHTPPINSTTMTPDDIVKKIKNMTPLGGMYCIASTMNKNMFVKLHKHHVKQKIIFKLFDLTENEPRGIKQKFRFFEYQTQKYDEFLGGGQLVSESTKPIFTRF
ncbi:unnamed protein product [Trichogramma brassicae]|uniref:Uncharacterized protein n=1 Tax=Trichogramma brassicae TaxID=86971 RepID=A0A6H5I9Q3_9HYME|nr:unnamed protein product [Trichogramma brassicae]